jgi:hypothetical protein
MNWKRILLFSLFFSILSGSLIYYVLPHILLYSLRIDTIPPNAYIVPWMRPNPPIEELNRNPQLPYGPPPFDIDDVMTDALKLNMTFRINIPNGTRVVPSTVYLGHDLDHFYVGGKFSGMYTNPASTNERTVPNIFKIFFDVANDGVLKQPESGSDLPAYITSKGAEVWFYHDLVWMDYVPEYRRASWILADSYYDLYFHKAQPDFAVGNMITEYDNSTGTLIILFSRFLWLPSISEVNALQIRTGERWAMGFLLELGYNTNSENGEFVDGWPQKTYPYLTNDASWWPKLVIDLTNPPPDFT